MELMNECRAACSVVLNATLDVEKIPFTQNTHYLEATTDKWLAKYKDIRAGKTHAHGSAEPPAKRLKTEIHGTPSANGAFAGRAETTNASQQINGTTSAMVNGAQRQTQNQEQQAQDATC